MFCQYKNIFGKPNEGVHSSRFFNIAIIDVVATIVGAFLLHKLFPKYKFIVILITLFIIGIIAHRLFCVRTTVDKLLFNEPRELGRSSLYDEPRSLCRSSNNDEPRSLGRSSLYDEPRSLGRSSLYDEPRSLGRSSLYDEN
jgi:hypothetical protein